MCGRFTQISSAATIAQTFNLENVHSHEPRYNIAPTQPVSTVRLAGERQFIMLHWGLIPFWAKDAKIGAKLINARAETVAEKPSFRSAFKQRRCLIVADGFYEWQQQNNQKQPFYIRMKDEQPFAFAGLWEQWQKSEEETIETCTLLTTEANEMMSDIHKRMPVILAREDYDLWLDTKVKETRKLQPLLKPYNSEVMTAYPVSTQVNNPRHDTPECIEEIAK
ncbi:MAG: SOS response-associated peptidase [Oscillatoria sp. PMC 1068.18]|nr:SOS response-associated peptidase [Oscillatoria sp. PMC 1076.18]MEC4991151.1 SOS response-associated peptidase [Oscillatoria sp. PMC 1068.18]